MSELCRDGSTTWAILSEYELRLLKQGVAVQLGDDQGLLRILTTTWAGRYNEWRERRDKQLKRESKMDDPNPIPAPDDPWIHRSQRMQCATCMWYVAKAVTTESGYTASSIVGRCRCHAPTHNGYPVVFQNDWCGDHKLDENKIGGHDGQSS